MAARVSTSFTGELCKWFFGVVEVVDGFCFKNVNPHPSTRNMVLECFGHVWTVFAGHNFPLFFLSRRWNHFCSRVEKSLAYILEKYDARASTSVAALACGNRMAAPCSLEESEVYWDRLIVNRLVLLVVMGPLISSCYQICHYLSLLFKRITRQVSEVHQQHRAWGLQMNWLQ